MTDDSQLIARIARLEMALEAILKLRQSGPSPNPQLTVAKEIALKALGEPSDRGSDHD